MYAVIADLVASYGEREIIQLSDRATTQTNTINNDLVNAKILDAENEINKYLICCFDMKKIKKVYDDGFNIPILKTWTVKISRKNLYDTIRLSVNNNGADHQAQREYQEVIAEIKELCKCGHLLDSQFREIIKRKLFKIKEDGSCVQYQCCHLNESKRKRGLIYG